MKKSIIPALLLLASAPLFQSCTDDGDSGYDYPTALVTVCPLESGSFEMHLDDLTTLYPANIKESPFGKKEVRALVNYTEAEALDAKQNGSRFVNINWIDSIRTKLPVATLGAADEEAFGNDPLEIIADWVTVAEDGYLTLRFRTLWGIANVKHNLSLVTGVNPSDPYEFVLRHDANGDHAGTYGDGIIAFNLNGLPRPASEPAKVTLRWNSFSGEKRAEFKLNFRKTMAMPDAASLVPAAALD